MTVPFVGSELPIRARWGQAVADNINAREPAWGGAPAIVGGTPPEDADFITQAGQTAVVTEGTGWNYLPFPVPFPNGLVAVNAQVSDGNPIEVCLWGPGTDRSRAAVIAFWIATGQRVDAPGNYVLVNWEAVGW